MWTNTKKLTGTDRPVKKDLHTIMLEEQFWNEPDAFTETAEMALKQATKKCDTVFAQEMSKLTIAEREKTYEELHGISNVVHETPELISQKLQELVAELANIPSKDDYNLAMKQNAKFVMDPAFLLSFLRTDSFVASKAAQRLVDYFELKRDYFGEEALARRIVYDDLDADDQRMLNSGQFQTLPVRDTSDRAVYINSSMVSVTNSRHPRSVMKVSMYIFSRLAEDEENQKRGIVMIISQVEKVNPHVVSVELSKESPRLMKCLPIRSCSLHFWFNDPVCNALVRIVLLACPARMQSGFRAHLGTRTEVMYTLMTYGIPVKLYPMDDLGFVQTDYCHLWIDKHRYKDQCIMQGNHFDGIDVPTRNDVLLGKGRPMQEHPGNVQLRDWVQQHLDEYISARKATRHTKDLRGTKTMVIKNVLELVQSSSGRFLSKDSHGWWHVASDADAHEKVMKVFSGAKTRKSKEASMEHIPIHSTESSGSFFMHQGKRAKYSGVECCPTNMR